MSRFNNARPVDVAGVYYASDYVVTGGSDNSASLQAFFDMIGAKGGGIAVFEKKTYKGRFTIPANVSIEGNFCTFSPPSTGTGAVITFPRYTSHCTFRNFFIIGNQSYTDATQHGIYVPRAADATSNSLAGINDCTFEQIVIRYVGGNGLFLEGGNYYSVIQLNTFRQMILQANGQHGLYCNGQVQSNTFDHIWSRENKLNGYRADAFLENVTWFAANCNEYTACNFEENLREGMYHRGNNEIFSKCWFEGNSRDDTTYSIGAVIDCVFSSSFMTFDGQTKFAQQYKDVKIVKGDENDIADGCSFAWSGIPATKACGVEITSQSSRNNLGMWKVEVDLSLVPNFIQSSTPVRIKRRNPPASVSVSSGATFVDVTLPITEFTTPYVRPTVDWLTTVSVTNRTRTGFRVNFGTAPSATQNLYYELF